MCERVCVCVYSYNLTNMGNISHVLKSFMACPERVYLSLALPVSPYPFWTNKLPGEYSQGSWKTVRRESENTQGLALKIT